MPLNLTGKVIIDVTREVILMVLFVFFIFFITLVLIEIERMVELHAPLATGGLGCYVADDAGVRMTIAFDAVRPTRNDCIGDIWITPAELRLAQRALPRIGELRGFHRLAGRTCFRVTPLLTGCAT